MDARYQLSVGYLLITYYKKRPTFLRKCYD